MAILYLITISFCGYAQTDTFKTVPNGTDGLTFKVKPIDTILVDKKRELDPNEFEGTYSTFRIGMGYIGDFTTHSYNNTFRDQLDSMNLSLAPTFKTRDFRILGSGRFLKVKRYLAWKFAYMYDGDKQVWMVRESGLTIGVPELFGHIFIGRTKVGFSMIKVMNGHSPMTNERQMAVDPIPILSDGIKWFGYIPKSRIFWNFGYYNDLTSKGQGFSTFEWQWVARAGWMPFNKPEEKRIMHIAGELLYGKPLDGKFSIKSRPQSNPTPQLIYTGTFATNQSLHIGGEAYYTNKRFTVGSEVVVHNFYSNEGEDHRFSGGNIVFSYFLTKTSRPYKTEGSIYGFVPVEKSIFKGGLGAIEAVFDISTFNLNDGSIQGGQFTRYNSMINWYLSRVLRWELIYGYGILDRFNKQGYVNFFETRIQVTMM